MPNYNRIHEKHPRDPRLCSYDYVQSNKLKITACSHNTLLYTRMIPHKKKFPHQTIYQGI